MSTKKYSERGFFLTVRGSIILLGTLCVVGCTNSPPPVNAIPEDRIGEVLQEIKYQTGVYISKQNFYREHPELDDSYKNAAARGFTCGSGQIGFDLASVTLELSTTTASTAGGAVGFSAPVGPASLGLTAGFSQAIDNVQKLTLPLFFRKDNNYRQEDLDTSSPISDVLLSLRGALLTAASGPGPCYFTYNYRDPKMDKGGTYILGLTITSEEKTGISIGLAPVVVDASGSSKSITGNTLTVSFQQQNIPSNPDLEDDTGEGFITASQVAPK